jgi:hypothetical protein
MGKMALMDISSPFQPSKSARAVDRIKAPNVFGAWKREDARIMTPVSRIISVVSDL